MHDLDATFEPIDTGLSVIEIARCHVPRLRRLAGPGLAPPAGRARRTAARRRRVHRLRRRPRPAPRARPVGSRRLRPFRHGHARPGLDLVGRRHGRPGRIGRAGPSRVHDPRHPRPADLLLPARVSPTPSVPSRRPARIPRWTPVADRRHRRQPGRRDQPSPPRPRPGPRRGHAGRPVPVRLRARDQDHRQRPVHRDRPLPAPSTATTPRPRLRTLAYFDGASLGRRATAPALFSVGADGRSARRPRSTPRTTRTPDRRRSSSTASTTTRAARASTRRPSCAGWPAASTAD